MLPSPVLVVGMPTLKMKLTVALRLLVMHTVY
jgi:hypothetical protein